MTGGVLGRRLILDGVEEFTYVPDEMPVSQAARGPPRPRSSCPNAAESEERWVLPVDDPRRSKPDTREAVETFAFPRKAYKVSFDVDRGDLPFGLRLVDFRRRIDPGTMPAEPLRERRAAYDEERGIDGEKVTISMNEPLTHRGFTFYQSSFNPPTRLQAASMSRSSRSATTRPGRSSTSAA